MTDLGPPVVPRPFGTLSNFPTPSSSGGWPSQPLAVVLSALLFTACSVAALGGEGGSPAPAGGAAPAEAGPVPAADRPILIGRITIEIVDVFDPSKPGEDGWFNRFVDLLHIRTREEVIRRQLLFHEGDVLDPEVLAETERNLRALGYLRKAEVTADQHENGVADVHVRVQDSWTTRASYRLGRTGGHTRAELEAQEGNLLGFGKQLGFSFASNQDRKQDTFEYSDEQLFGTRVHMDVSHTNSSDGNGDAFLLERPFFSYETPWAAGIGGSRALQTTHIYSQGEKLADFDTSLRSGRIYYGFSTGLHDNAVLRYSFGALFNRADYTNGRKLTDDCRHRPPPLAPECIAPVELTPVDRKVIGPFFEFRRESRNWIKAYNLIRMDRPEDFNLGSVFDIEMVLSRRWLGARADEGLLIAQMGRGFHAGPNGLLFINHSINGRIGSGSAASNTFELAATYYNTRFTHQTLVGHTLLDYGFNLDPPGRFLLGGDEGLRGFNSRVLDGNRRFLINLEDRVWTRKELFHLVYAGFSGFVDLGNAWGGLESKGFGGLHSDIGMGLRLDASRAAHGGLLRLDFAAPVSGDRRGGPAVLFSFGHGFGY